MIKSNIVSQQAFDNAVKECLAHEARTGNEFAVVFDRHGQRVAGLPGTTDQVDMPYELMQEVKGGILIHNHPESSGSFSDADLYAATYYQLAECWVCLADGSLFKSAGYDRKVPLALTDFYMLDAQRHIFPMFRRLPPEDWAKLTKPLQERLLSHAVNAMLLKQKSVLGYEWHFGPLMQEAVDYAATLGLDINITTEKQHGCEAIA